MSTGISNLSEFRAGIAQDKRDLADLINRETRAIALGILARLVDMSPVDTGRFRGNWQVDIGRAPEDELDTTDKSGAATKAKGSATIAGAAPFEPIYLVNNLPYAGALNDGHSRQAPAGFVEAAVDQVAGAFR
ncbi:HK97 gp10 family phage protein [Sandaracinobacteroides hominis]|uniref:HK97 gp10 family phage protein n=1 Tax=Sandaracinobacteroides hominis TaxID=2780086 RepID=UPI0018F2CF05|nr:HK97 gp10 family phage protein [Sandaracinobacteroides hominis]